MSDEQSSKNNLEPIIQFMPEGSYDPSEYIVIEDEKEKMNGVYLQSILTMREPVGFGKTSITTLLLRRLARIEQELVSSISAHMHDAPAAFSPKLEIPKPAVDFLGRPDLADS